MVVVMAMAMATAAAAAMATTAAAATVTGNGHLFTAHKGDADNREKHRDAQNQCTVHPRILQQKQVPWRNKTMPSDVLTPAWDGRQARNSKTLLPNANRGCRFNPLAALCKLYGLHKQTRIARLGR
jgi:hypothetical protein